MTLFFIANQQYMSGSKVKVTYIISDINKSLSLEAILCWLQCQDIDLNVILLNSTDSEFEKTLSSNKIQTTRINLPCKFQYPFTLLQIIYIIVKNKPQLIHCHLFNASFLGLMAAKLVGVKHRIHTRHHANLHHIYFRNAVKYDKMINRLSSHIITLSSEHTKLLIRKENVPKEKISQIPNLIDLKLFENISAQDIAQMKKKHGIPKEHIVIGAVSRYTEWKGVQYIIPAFANILKTNPNIHLVLANAQGDYSTEIKKLLTRLLPDNSYTEIAFENDINVLFHTFDIFIHVPIGHEYESFGQTYVEALACNIPSIFTLSGIATDFILNKKHALVVPYKNPKAIEEAIHWILKEPKAAQLIAQNGNKVIKSIFEEEKICQMTYQLYRRLVNQDNEE